MALFGNDTPLVLQGTAQGLLAGREAQIGQQNLEAQRQIAQQNADTARLQVINDQTAPARQMASTLYGSISGVLTDPERFAVVQDQGLVPFLHDALGKLGRAAHDGNLAVFDTLDPQNLQRLLKIARPQAGPASSPGAGPAAASPEVAATPTSPTSAAPEAALPPAPLSLPPGPSVGAAPQTLGERIHSLLDGSSLVRPTSLSVPLPASVQLAPGQDRAAQTAGFQALPAPLAGELAAAAPGSVQVDLTSPAAPDPNSLQGGLSPISFPDAAAVTPVAKPGQPLVKGAPTAVDTVKQPAYNPDTPTKSALTEISNRVVSIGHQIVGLPPATLNGFANEFVAGVQKDPGLTQAQTAFNTAAANPLYSPTVRTALRNDLHTAFTNAVTDHLAILNARLTPWTTANAINAGQAETLANLAKSVESAGAGYKSAVEANQVPIASQQAQEKIWIDAAKPIVDRIQAREMARSMNGGSWAFNVNLGARGSESISAGPIGESVGGGFNVGGGYSTSHRQMQARGNQESQIADILALRELGRGGNEYAAQLARGILNGARAEYFADPTSWSAIPPTDQVLRGLDYLHATDSQKAAFQATATRDSTIQRRRDIDAAEAWQKSTQLNYYGGKDVPLEKQQAAAKAAKKGGGGGGGPFGGGSGGGPFGGPLIPVPILPPVGAGGSPAPPGALTVPPRGAPTAPGALSLPPVITPGAEYVPRAGAGAASPGAAAGTGLFGTAKEPGWVSDLTPVERAAAAAQAKRINDGLPPGARRPATTNWNDWRNWLPPR